MLVHRDLALRDQPTRLNIFDRTIELVNPRRTVGFSPVAQKAIRYGLPERLNPQICCDFLQSCLCVGPAHWWIANATA